VLPASYPITGLVNQIRDTGVATVEPPHAEPGSNRAPLRRLAIGTSGTSTREVQSAKCREKVNDAFKSKRQLRSVEIRTVAGPSRQVQ
jgi:hypothetical protein